MNPTTIAAALGEGDILPAVEQPVSAVETSIAMLPASRMSVDARGLALGVLAVLAAVFTLSWAQSFLVPLLLGIIVTYTLNPLVTWLEDMRIPRVIGTVSTR